VDILINGTKIKTPNNPEGIKRGRFELSKGGRTADGTMTKDRIARKQKFFFVYDIISGTDLQTILDLIYFSDDTFFELTIDNHTGVEVFTIYVGELNSTLHRRGGLSGWYYKNFTFNLIEQ